MVDAWWEHMFGFPRGQRQTVHLEYDENKFWQRQKHANRVAGASFPLTHCVSALQNLDANLGEGYL